MRKKQTNNKISIAINLKFNWIISAVITLLKLIILIIKMGHS